jgi:hypothetical protein
MKAYFTTNSYLANTANFYNLSIKVYLTDKDSD